MNRFDNNTSQANLENENLYCASCNSILVFVGSDEKYHHYECKSDGNRYRIPNNSDRYKEYRKSLYDAIEFLPQKHSIQYLDEFRDQDLQYRLYDAALCTDNFSKNSASFKSKAKIIDKNIDRPVGFPLSYIGQELLERYKEFKERARKKRKAWLIVSIVLCVLLLGVIGFGFIPSTTETVWQNDGVTVTQNSSFFDRLTSSEISLSVDRIEEGMPGWAVAKRAVGSDLNDFLLFDIELLKESKKYNVERPLSVTIEFPETFRKNNVVVYHVSDGGEKEQIPIEISPTSNMLTFTTDHFSMYVIGEKPYNVKMETNGILDVSDQKVLWGGYVTEPNVAERVGYIFDGWFYKDQKWDFAADTITSDVVLKAQWTAKEYTLTLDPSGGVYSGNASVNVSYDSEFSVSNPTRLGYSFLGWFDGETRWEQSGIWQTDSCVSLQAHWKLIEYTIVYDGNGANSGFVEDPDGTIRSVENELPLATNAFLREGYDFIGWNTRADGKGISFINKSKVGYIDALDSSSVVRLYAQWQGKNYTVSFDTDDSEYISDIVVEFGSTYRNLPSCSKKGYSFIGWFTSNDGGTRVDESTEIIVADNHTLYPRFKINEYTVSFVNNDGASVSSQTVPYGSTITLAAPTHTYGDYYTFVGWSDNTQAYSDTYTVVEDTNITLTAKWQQVYTDYTYIFTADDFKWHIGNNLQKSPKPDNCGAGKYMLLNDVDLGDWNEGWGYTYWASNNANTTLNGKTCFSGVFDGQNHTITYKLRVGKTSLRSWAFGLFPVTDGATIKNLKVKADLSTYDPQNRGQKWHISNDDRAEDAMVGGLIGYAKNTIIENCSVSGQVIYNSDGGGGDTCVAGVVGYAYNSTVKNCSSSAEVYARGYYVNVAGVIACYYNTSYSGLSATGKIHFNEDWFAGGHWSGNEVVKSLKVL